MGMVILVICVVQIGVNVNNRTMNRHKIKPVRVKGEKRDENEADIISIFQELGAIVDQEVKEKGYDLTVHFRGVSHVVEVKNSEYAPKKKPIESMLTSNERTRKAILETVGIKYHIVMYTEDCYRVLGL